jgi:hypothetical protein
VDGEHATSDEVAYRAAFVAFADGNRDGADFSSSTIVETARRPSSMASIRPHGPPPMITTSSASDCHPARS